MARVWSSISFPPPPLPALPALPALPRVGQGGVTVGLTPLEYLKHGDCTLSPCRPGSVELSWEEIRHVCNSYGLEILHEERRDSTYNANRRGLMKTVYSGIMCSAVKRSKSC